VRPDATPQRAAHEAAGMEDTATDLRHLSVEELTTRLASRAPIPGGGSAAAIAGAMGAALVGMVAELTIGRPDAEPHATELAALRDDAARFRDELLALAQTDAAAYAAVVQARKLPKDTDDEKAARRAALDISMLAAADAPLHVARLAAATLELAARIAPIGNPNAASDAGVAAQLASAAVRGAVLNVRINLPYLPAGAELRETAPAELAQLEARAGDVERQTVAEVNRRIGPS
jgi:formiminotetrahydrofolate cyclodeaminase